MTKEVTTDWKDDSGFTMDEAIRQKASLDRINEVSNPHSPWLPAEIVRDVSKKNGYKVVAERKK